MSLYEHTNQVTEKELRALIAYDLVQETIMTSSHDDLEEFMERYEQEPENWWWNKMTPEQMEAYANKYGYDIKLVQ